MKICWSLSRPCQFKSDEVIKLTLPNILTIIRFLLIPLYVTVNFSSIQYADEIAIAIFVVAMFLDVLDGFIARRYNLITDLGKMLDPIADKCTMIAVLTCLVIKGKVSAWLLVFILIKELTMMIVGAFIYKKGKIVIPANIFGKLATCLLTLYIVNCVVFEWYLQIHAYIVVFVMVLAFVSYAHHYIKNHFRKGNT